MAQSTVGNGGKSRSGSSRNTIRECAMENSEGGERNNRGVDEGEKEAIGRTAKEVSETTGEWMKERRKQ